MAAKSARGRASGGDKGAERGSELVLVALGGLGEVGMNLYLYGLGPAHARRWLMVDLGITFPEGEFDPGVDVIFPDTRFIEEEIDRLEGILVTHAHEDHVGAVIELWPRLQVPVYGTPFTIGMLEAKLAENGGRRKGMELRRVETDSRFRIGAFDVELVTMAHSIPETSGVVLRTPHGTLFHTSDWKLEEAPVVGKPTDEARLARLGEEGVDILVCDSTNSFREGRSPSEEAVAAELARIVGSAKGRVVVTTFASNVARVKAIADAAHAAGRHLVVSGRALHRVIQVAIDTGYLPANFRFLDDEQFSYLDPGEVVALVTGSQGEPRAALARIAEKSHPRLALTAGDTVIFSSRTIPGNEREVGRIQNALAMMGCRIVTDADALVHVTGHPRREELARMYAWMHPRVVVPMHGEVRHLLENARQARRAGVEDVRPVVNGEMVRLAPGETAVIDRVPVGRLYRDGRKILDADDESVRNRRKLAFVGLVAVAVVLSKRGDLMAEPQIVLDGVPSEATEARSMTEAIRPVIEGTLKGIPAQRRKDREAVAEALRRSVRATVEQHWGKRPIVKVLLTSIDV
jgi:ribonuclease J